MPGSIDSILKLFFSFKSGANASSSSVQSITRLHSNCSPPHNFMVNFHSADLKLSPLALLDPPEREATVVLTFLYFRVGQISRIKKHEVKSD